MERWGHEVRLEKLCRPLAALDWGDSYWNRIVRDGERQAAARELACWAVEREHASQAEATGLAFQVEAKAHACQAEATELACEAGSLFGIVEVAD